MFRLVAMEKPVFCCRRWKTPFSAYQVRHTRGVSVAARSHVVQSSASVVDRTQMQISGKDLEKRMVLL